MRLAGLIRSKRLRLPVLVNGQVDKCYIAGMAFFLAVVLGLSAVCLKIYNQLSNSQLVPMTSILISGSRHYVNDSDLQRALQQVRHSGNFFTLDVNKVQKALLALPWVKTVSVRKQWPNKLRLYLQEYQPVAFWNNAALLNPQGTIFDAPTDRLDKPLVHLYGPDDCAAEVLEAYKQMQEMLKTLQIGITSVTLDARHSWSLTLTNGIEVRIGQRDRIKRLQRFISLYNQLHPEKMAYADLRYSNGLAIGWKQQQDSTAK
ncbi:cell division protein FtsQ/DivIB [Celerinatantimonas yamalensis]|uniref:Cell division protein FtsQ n=1 Tax=Celerinatantimonas yamalensis TaxID=559956 RepID=A0ABW9G566_9GAMM